MPGGQLQLRGEPDQREAGDKMPAAERHAGHQPDVEAGQVAEPVLHGQDERQIR